MLVGLMSWLIRQGGAQATMLITLGPLLWWIDKAHAEVFLFVALTFAVVLIESWPAGALMAAAVATAQNPAAGAVLAVCLVSVTLRERERHQRRLPLAMVVALAVAAAPAIYYRWHLGIWSPLSSTVARGLPGLRALFTPVIDPNLGLVVYAPILAALACVGAVRQSRRLLMLVSAAAIALLVVFAESGNVNHGGTPGMSRYALWLLAIATPLVLAGSERLRRRQPALWRTAALMSIVFSVFVFRPAWPDRAGDSPNWLASWLWTQWPATDNPLPEIFAERTYGSGGDAPVPVATSGCEKVLIRGDGREGWWPIPCAPRPAPEMCRLSGALCYVNDGVYARAPAQPTFVFDSAEEHSWTTSNAPRFYALVRRLGEGPRFVRLADRGGRIETVTDLEHLYIVEGAAGTAAWVRALPSTSRASVRIEARTASTLELIDAMTLQPVGRPRTLASGSYDVPLTTRDRFIVLIADQR
jgi:hypothetical protein